FGRDDAGKRRVAQHGNTRQLSRNGSKQLLRIVVAAAIGHGDLGTSDARLNLAGDFLASIGGCCSGGCSDETLHVKLPSYETEPLLRPQAEAFRHPPVRTYFHCRTIGSEWL